MALSYIDPVRHRLNLTIRANVQANRVVLEGKRAVGVEVESDGETFVVEGSEIILCTGAVASPQLLMVSGLGPAEQLNALGIPVAVDLPGVGQNMRDHPNVSVRYLVKEDVPPDPNGMRALRLRYTATGSDTPNDMILSPASLNTIVRTTILPTPLTAAYIWRKAGVSCGWSPPTRMLRPVWTTTTWKMTGTGSGCGSACDSVYLCCNTAHTTTSSKR